MKRMIAALPLMAAATMVAVPAQAAPTTVHKSTSSATHASSATQTAIAHAAKVNKFTGVVPVNDIVVSQIRIDSSGRWASALDTPRDHRTDPAQVVLRYTGGSWKAVDFGTDGVGCGVVSANTRAALHLRGSC